MYQPSPKPPIKLPPIPKVPGLLAVNLLVAQYLFLSNNADPEVICRLNVHQPHYSTSLNEFRRIDAVKINMESICSKPQQFTYLNVVLHVRDLSGDIQTRVFSPFRRVPSDPQQLKVIIRNVFIECNASVRKDYRVQVFGHALLMSGKKINLYYDQNKFTRVKCSSK